MVNKNYQKVRIRIAFHPLTERFLVMSILTGRYSGSPESQFDKDIKAISARPFDELLASIEAAELSDAFWEVGLVQNLQTSSSTSPSFEVFLAAQACLGDKGFLSKDILVRDMLVHHGDMHHIFPRNYLKKRGYAQGKYNQVANFVVVQQEINIKIGDAPPDEYLAAVMAQCESGEPVFGAITGREALLENLAANGLPEDLGLYQLTAYEDFLERQRGLMAAKMRGYYEGL